MKDTLGDRMKENYENRTRISLPRRTYTIIRVDGKAFHTYTKGLTRPFDSGLIEDMDNTAAYLCKNIMGAKFAYVQSDEISILITDFEDISTQSWFDSNLQKMCSVAASLATAKFNQLRMRRFCENNTDKASSISSLILNQTVNLEEIDNFKLAMFDARVFQIPQQVEVSNYFIWRQQDATRNSISSVAQSLYSSKELNKKSTNDMQEMIFQKGINWNDYSFREKRGGIIGKVQTGGLGTNCLNFQTENCQSVCDECNKPLRNKWELIETPIFTQEQDFLRNLIPNNN